MENIRIVMTLICYPILWIMVGALASQAKLKKGRSFGLAIPESEWNNGDVILVIRHCRKVLLWCGVILTFLLFPVLYIADSGAVLTYWMVWLMLVIAVPFILYGHYFNCMKRLKIAKCWELTKEEHFWHGGLWYYNKDNPKVFVSLFPGSSSLNLARLPGKIIMGFCVLCIISLPFFGVAVMKADRTEMVTTISEDAVIAEHGRTEYIVAYDDVTEVALLREMPDSSRSAGYESERLKKGKFTVEGYGSCTICVDARDEVILVLKTADRTYLFSFDTEAEALETINKIDMK
ncbi:MAG: hypothetical protein IJF43_04000 [Firmicutes bacterium]|nr:hypothetical protein [Bacillota bacterium]